MGFPDGTVVKNLPDKAGHSGSIPQLERSPGVGNGKPLQHSCLGNPMDKELDTAEHACTHTKCMYNKMIRRSLKLRAKENRHYDKWLASWLKTG